MRETFTIRGIDTAMGSETNNGTGNPVLGISVGVAGNESSLAEESFASVLLEYPHYTRPREWEGRAIPEVLLSGDHKKIAEWRRDEAEALTKKRRPDLWERHGKKNLDRRER